MLYYTVTYNMKYYIIIGSTSSFRPPERMASKPTAASGRTSPTRTGDVYALTYMYICVYIYIYYIY